VRSLLRDELERQFEEWRVPGYRVDQLLDGLYRKRADSWEAMSNLPGELRRRLAETWSLIDLPPVRRQGARDSTRKFLWQLPDGALVESVLIPANPALYSEASDRQTLCVSTQVGCAYGCRFCASGLDGWKRNLSVEEIVGQIIAAERVGESDSGEAGPDDPAGKRGTARSVTNLVFMGMGEPLANYDHLLKALRILNAPWGGGIGARKITVSTSGLVPQIRRFAGEPEQFRLAISLHGATDEIRERIMPVNRKYPLAELTAACEFYQQRKSRMITLEYILIAGINDDLAQVAPLARLARRLFAKVNLIPYNTVEGLEWRRPDDARCQAFADSLKAADVTATLRLEKGHDIDAACGQLRLKTGKELAGLAG
jgi:23S rRNA (adenine2503-C2)-methyltransferase